MKFKGTVFSDFIFIWLGLLLLISFIFLYQQINSLSESAGWVNKSNEIKLKLEEVLVSVVDAETGQRGYLLTHDSVFLDPYRKAEIRFHAQLADLDFMLYDLPSQREAIKRVRQYGDRGLEVLDVVIFMDSRSGSNKKDYFPFLDKGRLLMDSLRTEVKKMLVVQDRLLKDRIEERNLKTFITPLIAFVFFGVSLALLILSFLRIRRQLREQKDLKEKVVSSKIFLDSVLDTTPNSIVVYEAMENGETDPEIKDFKIIHANRSGVDKGELFSKMKVGHTLFEVFPNAKELGIYKHFLDVMKDGKSREFDFEYNVNGVMQWYKSSLNKLNNGVTASLSNITAIKKSAERLSELNQFLNQSNSELRNAQSFLQTLIDSSVDMILAYDENLKIIMLNKPAEKEYHLKRDKVLLKPLEEIFAVLPVTHNIADFKKALDGDSTHNEVVKDTAENKFYETFYIPLTSQNRIYGVLLIARNISEIVRVSQQIQDANMKLEKKNIQLEQSNQELASFSYVASHDLQEPLRKIQGFASRIVEIDSDKLSTVTKDYFERIVSAAGRMQNLIDALLNFSRTNTSDQVVETTDLNLILNDVKIMLKENIDEANAVIDSDILPTLPVIPVQIQQLFLNLIGNAIKYRKPNERANVKIKVDVVKGIDEKGPEFDPSSQYWKIEVSDNGIGFDQQYENKIFELFQRLHGRTEYSGTGIGLAICKKIVLNHNGIIKAIGSPGEGASFSVYFPLNR